MKRNFLVVLVAVVLLGIGTLAHGQDLDALMPLGTHPALESLPAVNLRGSHTLLVYAPAAKARVGIGLALHQVGRYEDPVNVSAPDVPDGQLTLASEGGGGPARGVLTVATARRGVFPIETDTAGNALRITSISADTGLVVEASERRPVHVISQAEALWFYVPRGVHRFAVYGRGGGGREHIRLKVFSPDGEPAGQDVAPGGRTARVVVTPSAEIQGKAWRILADRPSEWEGTFEDGAIWLSDDVAPYVGLTPDSLLAPFCSGLVQSPQWRGEGDTELRFGLNVAAPAGAAWSGDVRDAAGQLVAHADGRADAPLVLALARSLPAGCYSARVRLGDAVGAAVNQAETPVTLTANLLYVGGLQGLVSAELTPEEQGPPAVNVRRSVAGMDMPIGIEIALIRTPIPDTPGGATGEVVVQQSIDPWGEDAVRVDPPENLADGHYQWRILVRTSSHELLDVQHARFLTKAGARFHNLRGGATALLDVRGSQSDRAPGFVAFVPEGVDAIDFDYRPSAEDIARPLHVALARGEYEPATLGLFAVEPVAHVAVSISPLRHEADKNAVLPVDVRRAHYWAQRTSWRTDTYRVIPEMLEPIEPFAMAIGEIAQVWMTVHALEDAKPGLYRATVTVQDGDGYAWTGPFEVRVLPFALRRPAERSWGLYPDTSRWRSFPDTQVRAELEDIAAHGITTLMLYPPAHSASKYENGILTIDSTEFAKHVGMAKAAGLRGPWVMSIQALAGLVGKLTDGRKLADPEFKQMYQDYVRHFDALSKELDMGECVWHAVDEPWSPEQIQQVVTELGYVKELGLSTFTTAGPNPDPAFDAVLDVRCYSMGHLLSSEAALEDKAAHTRASGDRLWFYGSGCYTGEDGNMLLNRLYTGFRFWRSGAEGEWSWTFLRAKDNVYDDFDGESQREYKEACIVYPSRDQGAPMPTLQWEGIREGIDDYAYLYTLDALAKEIGGERGAKALEVLDEVVAQAPIQTAVGDMTPARIDAMRQRIIDAILELAENGSQARRMSGLLGNVSLGGEFPCAVLSRLL